MRMPYGEESTSETPCRAYLRTYLQLGEHRNLNDALTEHAIK